VSFTTQKNMRGMNGIDRRPALVVIAVICGLWTIGSAYLAIATLLQGRVAVTLVLWISGMVTMGIAAVAINRCGSKTD